MLDETTKISVNAITRKIKCNKNINKYKEGIPGYIAYFAINFSMKFVSDSRSVCNKKIL